MKTTGITTRADNPPPPMLHIHTYRRDKRRWYWTLNELNFVVASGGPYPTHDAAETKAREAKARRREKL